MQQFLCSGLSWPLTQIRQWRYRHLLSVSYTHKFFEHIHPQKLTWTPPKSPGPSLMQGTSSSTKTIIVQPILSSWVRVPSPSLGCRLSGGRQIPFHGSSTPLGCFAVSWAATFPTPKDPWNKWRFLRPKDVGLWRKCGFPLVAIYFAWWEKTVCV